MWYVYILECKDKSFYTGSTNDLEKRFAKHKSGKGSKYVRSRKAERIVFSEKYDKKILALKRERDIKNLTRKEKQELIKSHN